MAQSAIGARLHPAQPLGPFSPVPSTVRLRSSFLCPGRVEHLFAILCVVANPLGSWRRHQCPRADVCGFPSVGAQVRIRGRRNRRPPVALATCGPHRARWQARASVTISSRSSLSEQGYVPILWRLRSGTRLRFVLCIIPDGSRSLRLAAWGRRRAFSRHWRAKADHCPPGARFEFYRVGLRPFSRPLAPVGVRCISAWLRRPCSVTRLWMIMARSRRCPSQTLERWPLVCCIAEAPISRSGR